MSQPILFYRDLQPSATGTPVLILHGVFGSSDNWLTLGKKLAEEHRVLLVDLRNHGQSFHHADFTYAAMVQDIINLADHLGLAQFHLIGHSMGGKVAMATAQTIPDRVARLIVVDIAPKVYPPHHQLILEAMTTADLATAKSRKEVDERVTPYIPDLGTRQFILKNIKRGEQGMEWKLNLPVIKEKIEEVGANPMLETVFEKPTLFIKGGDSAYINVQDAALLAASFPNYDLEVIDGANHWVHATKPEETLDSIRTFLQD